MALLPSPFSSLFFNLDSPLFLSPPSLNHQNRAIVFLPIQKTAAATAEPSTSSSTETPNPSNVGRASAADASASADTYAVVEIGGVQLLLEEGRWYSTDRLAASAGSTLALGRVLAVKKDGKFSVGTPYGRRPRGRRLGRQAGGLQVPLEEALQAQDWPQAAADQVYGDEDRLSDESEERER